MKNKIHFDSIARVLLRCCIGFSLLLLLYPYFVWGTSIPSYLFVLFTIGFIVTKNIIFNKNIVVPVILLFLVIFQRLLNVSNQDSVISMIISMFSLILLLFVKKRTKLYCYDAFKDVFCICLFFSMIIYVIVVFIKIDLPFTIITPLNILKAYNYYQYPLLLIPDRPSLFFRFHAFFEEPGVVGTISAIMLWADRYDLRDRKNLVLFISGLMSFSLFFYIISVFYLAYYFKKKYFFRFLMLFAIGIPILYYSTKEIVDYDYLLFDRLKYSDGKLEGNNRSSDTFDSAYEQFMQSESDFLFGKGENAHTQVTTGLQTYKMAVYDYGIINIILLIMFFVSYASYIFKGNMFLLVGYLIFFLGYFYQRPTELFRYGIFFLITVAPLVLVSKQKKHNLDSDLM